MLEQLLLLALPLEFTFQALVALLVFGERSHQLVAVTGHTPAPVRCLGRALPCFAVSPQGRAKRLMI